jgi:hypothetical protein
VLDTPGVRDGLIGFRLMPNLSWTARMCGPQRCMLKVPASVHARYCAGRRYQHQKRRRHADANDDGLQLTPPVQSLSATIFIEASGAHDKVNMPLRKSCPSRTARSVWVYKVADLVPIPIMELCRSPVRGDTVDVRSRVISPRTAAFRM